MLRITARCATALCATALCATALCATALAMSLLVSCGGGGSGGGSPAPPTRAFLLGFTPWPFDATVEAVDWVYDRIAQDGDLICHHLEEGVPWNEALAGAPFPAGFQAELAGRAARRLPGQRVLLSLNALDVDRSGLARYRGASPNEPLPSPWDALPLDHDDVKTAYVAYVAAVAAALDPDYLTIGIEANLLLANAPAAWGAYVRLQQHVYTAIKSLHPSLPVGIGVFGPALLDYSPEHDPVAQLAALRQLETSADFVGLSIYPFMSTLLADSLPADYCARLFALVQRPAGISECGYPAQTWQLPSPPTMFAGTPEKQAAFVAQALRACQDHGALFAVWFTIRDYDALWSGVLGQDPVALVWRDTGLFDESGSSRLGHAEWSTWRARALSR